MSDIGRHAVGGRRLFFLPISLLSGLFILYTNRGVVSYLWRTPRAFTFASIQGIVDHTLWPLLLGLIAGILFLGLGRGILGLLNFSSGTKLENHLMATAMGFGMFALSVCTVGLAGFYRPGAFIGLCSFLLLIAGLSLWRYPAFASSDSVRHPPTLSRPAVLLLAVTLYSLWHAALVALAPPTLWDGLAYHLALPKLYLRAGRMLPIPWMIHAHWPHLMEMVYGVPLAWGINNLPSLLHLGAAVFILLWIWTFARKEFDASTSLLAVALMASQTVFLNYAGTPHSDALYALYYVLSASMLALALRTRSRQRLILAGILGGFAASTKLMGLVLITLLPLCLLFNHETPRPRWRWTALYMFAGFLIVLPWYVYTWHFSGDPVWPFLSGVFADRQGGASLRAPYVYSCHWQDWPIASMLSAYGAAYLWIPLLFSLAVFLFYKQRLPKSLRLFFFPLPIYAILFATHTEFWRFLWPFLPGLVIVTAAGIVMFWRRTTWGRFFLLPVLATAFWPLTGVSQNNALFAVLELHSPSAPGAPPRSLYLERTLPVYGVEQHLNVTLPTDAKVLLFQEIRGFYLDRDYQWGDPLNQGLIRYQDLADARALRDTLAGFHITHVLRNRDNPLYQEDSHYYDARTLRLMDDFLSQYAVRLWEANGCALYQIR